MCDQDRIPPHNINTISSRQVMRIKKYINQAIISWPNTKLSKLIQELFNRQYGELPMSEPFNSQDLIVNSPL